jgi:hypothetical protein
MKLNKIEPKFISKPNPRIGLIALGSDFRIEKDFINVIYARDIDLYINRTVISLFENYLVFIFMYLFIPFQKLDIKITEKKSY